MKLICSLCVQTQIEYTFRIFPYSEFVNIGPCCAEIILLQ